MTSDNELSGILASLYSTAIKEGHSLVGDKILIECQKLSPHVIPFDDHKVFDEEFAVCHLHTLMTRHPDVLIRRLAATLHQERLMTQLRADVNITSSDEFGELARCIMDEMGNALPQDEIPGWRHWPGTFDLSYAAARGVTKYINKGET